MTTLFAPAKLTTYLHLTGKRHDGYHTIDAEMVSLDFGDTLEVRHSSQGSSVTGCEGVSGADNLITKVLERLGRHAEVRVAKRIPMGAGLGGGSANAAAILRWAGVDDPSFGAQFGADVPFCMRGGRAQVSGIGEVVRPREFEHRTYTLLLLPFFVSTAEVFAEFDRQTFHESELDAQNHLWHAAASVEPRLSVARKWLHAQTRSRVCLAGSGSTLFVEGAFAAEEPVPFGGVLQHVQTFLP